MYVVRVHTGDEWGAGTDANIFLNLYGENGDTGERELKDSSTHTNKFERNHVSLFFIHIHMLLLSTGYVECSGSVGRVLDLGLKGRWFDPYRQQNQCVVPLSKALYLLLSTGSTQVDPS